MTARLILVCHASTAAVRAPAFPTDEPLDEHGRERAKALAKAMPRIERCFSSPELRAMQTAEALGLNAVPMPILRDCDYGTWRGRVYDDVVERDPHAVAEWLRDASAAPHGGESLQSLMQRVGDWLASENVPRRQTIVVTHASVIRAAIVKGIEAELSSFWRIDIAPLSVTRLSGDGSRWNLSEVSRP
jgi:broad specificity phosphatase PhoE